MHIAVVGLSHRTAPVEVREKLSIPEELVEKSFNNLKKIDQILEVSILSTCNRLEIYSLVKDPQLGIEAIKSFLLDFSGLEGDLLFPHLFYFGFLMDLVVLTENKSLRRYGYNSSYIMKV